MKTVYLISLLSLYSLTSAAALTVEDSALSLKAENWAFHDKMSQINTHPEEPSRYGIEVNDQDEQHGSNARSKHIAVTDGETYQLDFDANLASGSGIAVYLQFFDAAGKKLANVGEQAEVLLVIPPKAEGWNTYSLQAAAPANTKTLTVWLHSFNQNKVHAYFGNFSLKIAEGVTLRNADFEAGAEHWAIRDQMSTVDSSAAMSGKLGLLVNDRDKSKGSDVRSQQVAIVPGLSYQLDFNAQIITGGGIAVYLQFYDAKGKVLGSAKERTQFLRAIPTDTKAWKSFSLAATAPLAAKSVIIWVHSFNGNTVQAYFDDFSLKVIPEAAVKNYPSEQASLAKPAQKSVALTEFEKKKSSAEFAKLKILQSDGSAFRQPQENWSQARRLIQTDSTWQDWFTAKQVTVDAWIANHHDRAGWEAGWNHEFISPIDNSFLVWTEEVPGEQVDHFISKTGDRIEITPKLTRAWVGIFRKKHASMLIEAAYLYHLTEDDHYAEWVADQLDFYADNYNSWGNGESQNKYSWLAYQSLDDAVIISRMIDATRLIFEDTDEARRQSWFEKLFKPEAQLLSRSYRNIHNIAMWQRATQAKIALLYDDAELWQQAIDTEFGIKAQFRYGVTSEYFWYEQSMGYNNFIVMATESLFTFTGLLGKNDLLREEAETTQNLMLAPLAIRFPDNTLPNPADNTATPYASTTWLSRTYRILPTYLGLESAIEQYNWNTLMDPPSAIIPDNAPTPAPMPKVISQNLESSQFALLKEGPWQIFFHIGQLNRSHAQSEALNWSASYRDTLISYDAGTVGYGSPMSVGYYKRGPAHNVPLINGLGQETWKPGKLLNFDTAHGTVAAEQSEYRSDVSAKRILKIEGSTLIDTVSVSKQDNTDAEPLGLTLHLEGQPQLSEEFHAVSKADFTANRAEPFQYWSEIKSAAFEDSATIPMHFNDNTTLDVTFNYNGAFTLYVATAPGHPPTSHASFYLETADAHQATFITKLSPSQVIEVKAKKSGFWSRLFGR